MPIMIGENYRVLATMNNLVLSEKFEHRKSDEPVEFEDEDAKVENGWRNLGYYSNFQNAMVDIARLEVSKSELKDVETVLKAVEKVEKMIKDLDLSEVRSFTKKDLTQRRTKDSD